LASHSFLQLITWLASGSIFPMSAVEVFEHEVTLADFAALSNVYYDYLNRFYCRNGFYGLSLAHGVRVEQVALDASALTKYLTKLPESTALRLSTAQEVTRADLKQGRAGSLLPFDILARFFETGDMTLLNLYHEFERESFGRSVIRFTKGLRALLLADEPDESDEEKARKEIGGADIMRISGSFYRKLAQVPGLEGKVLTALDTGGFAALVELLSVYHLDTEGAYWRLDRESNNDAD
jgi:hypothetical protein